MYENKRVKFLYKCLTWLVLLLQVNFSSGCQLSESKSNVNCSHVRKSWWLRLWNLIICWTLTNIKCGVFADPSDP